MSLLAEQYGKPIIIVETAYPWTLAWFDDSHNIVGESGQLHDGYEASPEGQRAFLRDLLAGASQAEVKELGRRAMNFATDPPFEKLDRESRRRAVEWEAFIVDVFRVYQDTALREVGPEPIVGPDKMRLPDIWR